MSRSFWTAYARGPFLYLLYLRAFGAQEPGGGEADARGAAGDEDGLVFHGGLKGGGLIGINVPE